jgi:hypothetical protein
MVMGLNEVFVSLSMGLVDAKAILYAVCDMADLTCPEGLLKLKKTIITLT